VRSNTSSSLPATEEGTGEPKSDASSSREARRGDLLKDTIGLGCAAEDRRRWGVSSLAAVARDRFLDERGGGAIGVLGSTPGDEVLSGSDLVRSTMPLELLDRRGLVDAAVGAGVLRVRGMMSPKSKGWRGGRLVDCVREDGGLPRAGSDGDEKFVPTKADR
jgi:hypothetical protein